MNFYRAVGRRVAVSSLRFNHLFPNLDWLKILEKSSFSVVNVDVVDLATEYVGKSVYRLGSHPGDAPEFVDCSSFIKWVYGKRGIWLPRRAIQQSLDGFDVPVNDRLPGDAVFVSGFNNYYVEDSKKGVGHVGIIDANGDVIHASYKNGFVSDISFNDFVSEDRFRCIKRYILKNDIVITFSIPEGLFVETEDDLRWIVVRKL